MSPVFADTIVAPAFAPPVAGLLESADGVNREIVFPPSAEWEKLPQSDENQFPQIRR